MIGFTRKRNSLLQSRSSILTLLRVRTPLYSLSYNILDEVADIRTEISLLTQLKLADVQNVTRYYGSHLYGSKLWIIMDYCHGGSIRTLVKTLRLAVRLI